MADLAAIREEGKQLLIKIKELHKERNNLLSQLETQRERRRQELDAVVKISETSLDTWKEFLTSLGQCSGYKLQAETEKILEPEVTEFLFPSESSLGTPSTNTEVKTEEKSERPKSRPPPKKRPPPPGRPEAGLSKPNRPPPQPENPTSSKPAPPEDKPAPPAARPAPPSANRPAPPSGGSRAVPPGGARAPPGAGSRFAVKKFENPVLNMVDKSLKEIEVEWEEKGHLTECLFGKNVITSLPDGIKTLTKLQKLEIGNNRFESVPACLFELSGSLKELYLQGNRISSFGTKWDSMVHLTKLDLENNKLGRIPEEILAIPSLTYLNLHRNQLSSIPAALFEMKSLTWLGLRWNEFTEIPHEIGQLIALEELILSDNLLTTFPNTIENMQSLRILELSHNNLKTLPAEIGKLASLEKLHVHHNVLESIPAEMFLDDNFALVHFLLQHNKITELPLELFEIDSLVTLNAMANQITSLPKEIGHLVNLATLNMASNKIPVLPEEVGHLEFLEELNVGFNDISLVPDSINNLTSLQKLYLGYNKISVLPEIPNCECLWEYFVTGNSEITKLPDSLWTLTRMSKIYASNMKLTEIPKEIVNLEDVELLDFGFNQIKEIPEELGDLQILRRINVTHNQISALPSLSRCYDMQNVDISYNQFTEVPVEDFEMLLERDAEVLFDGNPASEKCEGHIKEEVLHLHPSKRFPVVGFADMIGKRPSMEDAMAMQGTLNGEEHTDFYGLYDGHAGREAASWCGKHVHKVMLEHLEKGEEELSALIQCYPEVNQAFKDYLYSPDFTGQSKYCGTTAVSVYIKNNDIYVVNVGDSRAVICRDGKPLRLSYDHKPFEDTEQDRIRSLGGSVIGETGRVNGLLAVSRSIGDFYMHPFVVDTPFSQKYELKPEDEFMVIACDGVWDEIEDECAMDLIREEKNPFIASCMLRDYAYLLASDDNISVMIVHLQ